MAYQFYRNITLGNSRQESLDEGSLNPYRFCDNVWVFVLNDVEFREVTEHIKMDKVEIVVCDGKNTGSSTAAGIGKKWLFYAMSFYYSLLFEEKHRGDF
uniref:Transcription initiation factor IIA subunit 2 n=1 Tax=Chinchilla lanigera TaxID=34839 RepID=A0A8C2VC42_CHILA